MEELLDSSLVCDLRDVINKTNIFVEDPVEKEKFDLICAVMDRFDDSIKYINNYVIKNKDDNAKILYMHHCCIIRDGIKQVCDILNISIPVTNYFKKYCIKDPINISPEEYKSDDKFFEYLRALFFAHPFITSRSIVGPIKGEIQYSPYILGGPVLELLDYRNPIGVRVYSNKRDMFSLIIELEDLNDYIKEKFSLINNIISGFKIIIENKNNEWKKRKVNRKNDNVDILYDILDILKERYQETDEIEKLIEYLTCDNSLKENEKNVNKYRKLIIKEIPNICDCIDDMDYDGLYDITNNLLYRRPKKQYEMMYYQLEKIYGYLNDEYGDISWGLKQAELFSKEFAKKWVIIKPYEMSFVEIKLLVTIALYFESEENYKNEQGN